MSVGINVRISRRVDEFGSLQMEYERVFQDSVLDESVSRFQWVDSRTIHQIIPGQRNEASDRSVFDCRSLDSDRLFLTSLRALTSLNASEAMLYRCFFATGYSQVNLRKRRNYDDRSYEEWISIWMTSLMTLFSDAGIWCSWVVDSTVVLNLWMSHSRSPSLIMTLSVTKSSDLLRLRLWSSCLKSHCSIVKKI